MRWARSVRRRCGPPAIAPGSAACSRRPGQPTPPRRPELCCLLPCGAKKSIATMIATFQTTGDAYESRKRRCELRTPRHHADSTRRPAPGNRIRVSAMVRSRFSPVQCGPSSAKSLNGVVSSPASTMTAMAQPRSARNGAGPSLQASSSFRSPAMPRVTRDEGRGECAFPEEVLEEVRNPERGVQDVGRFLQAKEVRDDALPGESGNPTQQNAGRDQVGSAAAGLRRHAAHAFVAVAITLSHSRP